MSIPSRTNRLPPTSVLVPVLLLAGLALPARADGPAGAAGPYTLFNPTPDSQLRGMDTDRPNLTNTPHTVDPGHWQLEAGFLDYAHYRGGSAGEDPSEDDFTFGQLNLRLGVLEDLELNFALDAYRTARTGGFPGGSAVRASGLGDTVVGGKLNFWGDQGGDAVGATALAIQPQLKFPTAGRGVGNGRFECSVAFPFLANLPGGFHFSFQPGVSQERNSANTGYVTGLPSAVALDRTVGGNLDVYAEYACDPTTERHASPVQTLDVGGTYPLGPNVVLDAGVNFGLDRAAADLEVLTGISVRR
jgi:Putative MetA-pathway of phenol degradation